MLFHPQGQFVEGKMHGNGVYTWEDGVTYEGEFVHNQILGKGMYRWKDGRLVPFFFPFRYLIDQIASLFSAPMRVKW